MDVLRLHCFPKEREYMMEMATWSQKMGFACLSIVERTTERHRLTEQIGYMMVPDLCVTSAIEVYVDSNFLEEHQDTLQWISDIEKIVVGDRIAPHPSPARYPLATGRDYRVTAHGPDHTQPEGSPPAGSRAEENVRRVESETNDVMSDDGEDGLRADENGNPPDTPTPLSLSTLMKKQKRLLQHVKKYRSMLCNKAVHIDTIQASLPQPFIPLYNKALQEMRETKTRIRRAVKKFAYHALRYNRLLHEETKMRQQIYQNLVHVTPLQVLLLGHLPRDQQVALLDVISSARKFSVQILISRLEEIRLGREIEMQEITGKSIVKM